MKHWLRWPEFTRDFIVADCARFGLSPGSEDLLLRPVDEAAESLCAFLRPAKSSSRRGHGRRNDLTMQLRYDDDFVEGAVFIRASSRRHGPPSLQVRRFHGAREKLYAILDPDERNTAFFNLHLDWFREWGWRKCCSN